jgi:hypothetical protein
MPPQSKGGKWALLDSNNSQKPGEDGVSLMQAHQNAHHRRRVHVSWLV